MQTGKRNTIKDQSAPLDQTEDSREHAAGEHSFGVDGETGKVVDMKDHGLYESAAVKVTTKEKKAKRTRKAVRTRIAFPPQFCTNVLGMTSIASRRV
jgi:flagellar hook assembly protein FlgD